MRSIPDQHEQRPVGCWWRPLLASGYTRYPAGLLTVLILVLVMAPTTQALDGEVSCKTKISDTAGFFSGAGNAGSALSANDKFGFGVTGLGGLDE